MERINKIKLAGRLTKEANATPKPKRENPIAYQKFADEACDPSQPQIMPPKKATIMPPYIASTRIERIAKVGLKIHGIKAKKTNKHRPQ